MIISHKYKFVFIHCRKVAGTSIKSSLYRYLGPQDIAVSGWADAVEWGIWPNRRMRWWALRPPGTTLALLGGIRGRAGLARGANLSIKRTAALLSRQALDKDHHLTARVIEHAYPSEWDQYFKFCFVRNPYERVLSDYLWRTRDIVYAPTFKGYVFALESGESLNGLVPAIPDNWRFYTIDDCVAVDYVGRYEQLGTDLQGALRRIGLPWDGWLPRAKSAGSENAGYRKWYDEETRASVERTFQQEIERFSYTF
jgi:hypothetical protein